MCLECGSPKTDKLGKCDPYVVMAIDDDSHKTKTANSVYDHSFKESENPYKKWESKSRNSTLEVALALAAACTDAARPPGQVAHGTECKCSWDGVCRR